MDHKRLRQARWTVRSRLSERGVYLAVARRKYGHMVVSEESELLIDGFTRSGVVFATIAFQLAQPRPVRLAHLLHSPAHVVAGARLGIPCLVTVRDPRDAVLSALIRERALSVGQLLTAHERFYRTLMPYRKQIVVAPFARVTTDLGGLTDELNHRFGRSFTPPDLQPEFVARTFELIDERAQRPPWEDRIGEFMSGLGLSTTSHEPDIRSSSLAQHRYRSSTARRAPRMSVRCGSWNSSNATTLPNGRAIVIGLT